MFKLNCKKYFRFPRETCGPESICSRNKAERFDCDKHNPISYIPCPVSASNTTITATIKLYQKGCTRPLFPYLVSSSTHLYPESSLNYHFGELSKATFTEASISLSVKTTAGPGFNFHLWLFITASHRVQASGGNNGG